MSDTEAPVRFELSINGEHLATGGVEYGVLDATVVRVAREPTSRPGWANDGEDFDEEEWYREEITVSLGGIDGNDYVRWVDEKPIQTGDEIFIRLLGAGPIDVPASRVSQDETWNEIHPRPSSQEDRDIELELLEEELENAEVDLLTRLNTSETEFDHSRRRYEHALSAFLESLIFNHSTPPTDKDQILTGRAERARIEAKGFLGRLLCYRKHQSRTSDNS